MKITFKSKKLNLFLKKTGVVLCTTTLIGTTVVTIYDTALDRKLNQISFSEENINNINDFFEERNQESVIFIMNDSQGINLNVGFWKNSYPEYLSETLNATVIDGSSLRFNKISHVNMLLEHNLTLKELKQLNNEGANLAIRTYAQQINVPTNFLQNLVGNLGEFIFGQRINSSDDKIHITDLLKNTEHPIIIYSSGANDIMFLAKANPASLHQYDSEGNITPKYLYAKEMLENEAIIDQVIDDIEENFNFILSINPNSQIIVLSIYVPKSLQDEEYQVFANAIEQYNAKLKALCEKYNLTYVDNEYLGEVYNQSGFNYHINEQGHKKLASILIDTINTNLTTKPYFNATTYNTLYDNAGLDGIYQDLMQEVINVQEPSIDSLTNYYLYEVYCEQLEEKMTDADTCQKVITR